jgi:hypothetical protein
VFPADTDWQVQLEHHTELLRIEEQEPLARAATRAQPKRQSLGRQAADWIGTRLSSCAWTRQPACGTQPALKAREMATEPW